MTTYCIPTLSSLSYKQPAHFTKTFLSAKAILNSSRYFNKVDVPKISFFFFLEPF